MAQRISTLGWLPTDVRVTIRGPVFVIRSSRAGTQALAEDIRRTIWSVNGNLAIADMMTMERIAGHFQRLLERICETPKARLSQLDFLGEAEKRQLLVEWNGARIESGERCLHELFEEQVRATPEAVAVVFGGERLTYAELDTRANRLAHHLRACGVGPDTLVGLCLQRSLEMVVGILWILKAGGAYVPFDGRHPAERIRQQHDQHQRKPDPELPILRREAHEPVLHDGEDHRTDESAIEITDAAEDQHQ